MKFLLQLRDLDLEVLVRTQIPYLHRNSFCQRWTNAWGQCLSWLVTFISSRLFLGWHESPATIKCQFWNVCSCNSIVVLGIGFSGEQNLFVNWKPSDTSQTVWAMHSSLCLKHSVGLNVQNKGSNEGHQSKAQMGSHILPQALSELWMPELGVYMGNGL